VGNPTPGYELEGQLTQRRRVILDIGYRMRAMTRGSSSVNGLRCTGQPFRAHHWPSAAPGAWARGAVRSTDVAGTDRDGTSTTAQLVLGARVVATDAVCGLVHSLVVGPAGARVAHLVVEPEHRIGLGRLVPVTLVGSAQDDVELTCDHAGFEALAGAERTEMVPGVPTSYVYIRGPAPVRLEVHGSLPPGETGLGSGTLVLATDGPVGTLTGLLTSPPDHTVVYVLVSEERHLWGHKTVALPMRYVAGFENGVQLNIAADEARRLSSNWPSPPHT
jgi:hypothetical protein